MNAFWRAAATVLGLPRDIREVLEVEGPAGLVKTPKVGRGIASAIIEIVVTGRWCRLGRLRGEHDAGRLFRSLPGIGPVLAERIHDTLHIDNLEALKVAAHDGPLGSVPGVGQRRVAAVRASLADMLGPLVRPATLARNAPPISVLLDLDQEYLERVSVACCL